MEQACAKPHPDAALLRPIENPGRSFYYIVGGLLLIISYTGFVYFRQLWFGLGVTGMTDHVSWGLYISNFSFLVGMAAEAGCAVAGSVAQRRPGWARHRGWSSPW